MRKGQKGPRKNGWGCQPGLVWGMIPTPILECVRSLGRDEWKGGKKSIEEVSPLKSRKQGSERASIIAL